MHCCVHAYAVDFYAKAANKDKTALDDRSRAD